MTSRPGPTRIRKLPDERRAEILRTAARIALEEGLERITLRRVADELGVRPGLIGHYFPAADNLVSEAFADAAAKERDALLPAAEEDLPPADRLARFLARLDDASSRDLSRLWLNARHLSRFKEGLREVVEGQEAVTRGALTALVEDGVKAGEFTTDDPLGAALHILVVVDGLGAYANGSTDVGHPAIDGMAMATADRVLGLAPGTLRGRPPPEHAAACRLPSPWQQACQGQELTDSHAAAPGRRYVSSSRGRAEPRLSREREGGTMTQPPGPYGPPGMPGGPGGPPAYGGPPPPGGSGPGAPAGGPGGTGAGPWQPSPPSPSLPGVPPPPSAPGAPSGPPSGPPVGPPGGSPGGPPSPGPPPGSAYPGTPPPGGHSQGSTPPYNPYGSGPGGTPPPTAPRDPAQRRLTAILATVVALALIAAGTLVWLFVLKDDGGDGTSNTATDGKTMARAWATPDVGMSVDMIGAWTSGTRTFAGDQKAIVAYDIADGREVGKFTPPTGQLCGMVPKTSQGIGIAMYGADDDCDTTVAVDLATMRSLWDKKTKDVASTDDRFRTVQTDVDGEQVVVTTLRGIAAYDLKTGDQRWKWDASETDPEEIDGLRVDGKTVLVTQTPYEEGEPAVLTAFDSGDGTRKWSKNISPSADSYATVSLIHADPALVEIKRNGEDFFQAYDANGNLRSEIPERGPEGVLDLEYGHNLYDLDFGAPTRYAVVVAKDTLSIMSTRRDLGPGEAVRLVAFDLNTGKARWSKPLGKDVGDGDIVGSDPTGVLVLGKGLPGTPGRLMAFKHEDGSSLGARAVGGKDLLGAEDTDEWLLTEGRLVGFTWFVQPGVPGLVTLA